MYQVEGTAGPSVIWGEVVGIWEHFFSPVIMSQPLREPLPLDCELHKCFSFLLPTLLGGTGCLDWAEVGFSHNWAGSAMPCLSSFSWGQVLRRVFWYISEWFLFLSPSWKPEGLFLCYLLWEPDQAPGGTSQNIVAVVLWLGPPCISYSAGSPEQHWFLELFWLVNESLLHQAIILCIYLLVSVILGAVVYCVLPLLGIPKALLVVQSVRLFTCCQDRVMLICRTSNWKSCENLRAILNR